MTRTDVERLLDLPPSERLHLAEMLLDSVIRDDAQSLTTDERQLIEARLAAYRASPAELFDWNEIKDRATRR